MMLYTTKLSLTEEHWILLMILIGNVAFLLVTKLTFFPIMSLGLTWMVYYHVVLLPLIGWSCEYLFKIVKIARSRDVNSKTISPYEKTVNSIRNYPLVTLTTKYARLWAFGFIGLISMGLLLGFFLNALTRNLLLISIQLFLMLVIVALITTSRFFVMPVGKRQGELKANSQWLFLSVSVKFLFVLLTVMMLMLLPRIPILIGVGGVLGVDTWYASALASRIVATGRIDFLSGILGFLEVYPTEKAVVAPLSLALISVFSETGVLDVQFFHVLWMTVMGLFLFVGFLDNFLSEWLRHSRWPQPSCSSATWKLGIFVLLYYFYMIPTILAYTDGFLTGRTIFFVFFPLFLNSSWEFLQRYHDAGVVLNEKAGELFIIAIFLTISHRMALVVMIPLLLLSFLWIYWNGRNDSPPLSTNDISAFTRIRRNFSRHLDEWVTTLPLLAFVGANFILFIQVILSKNNYDELVWFNRFYTYQYLPQWFIDLISVNRILDGMIGGFVGISLASGGMLPIFIVMLVITLVFRDELRPRNRHDLAFKFSHLLMLSGLPAMFLLYQGGYFYQVLLPLMFVIVITRLLLLLEAMNRRFIQVTSPSLKLRKKKIHFKKYMHSLMMVFVVFFATTGIIIEQVRVNTSLNVPEGDKRHVSKELKQLAFKLTSMIPEQESNITVLVSRGTIALKLSVLMPWVRFIPNHRSLYGAYGLVSYNGYQLKEFPTALNITKIFGWLKYPFDATPLYTFEQTLQEILASNVSSIGTRQVLQSWNVKYAVVEKTQQATGVTGDQRLLFSTLEGTIDPLFETKSFIVYDLTPLLDLKEHQSNVDLVSW